MSDTPPKMLRDVDGSLWVSFGDYAYATHKIEEAEARIAELEQLLKDIHADLLMRAEYAEDGALCAGLSNSIWARLKRAALRGEG